MKLKKLISLAALMIGLSFGGTAFAADDNNSPLYKNNKIEDHVIGSPDAKVTIVEYASLTCPHCANFHENTFKQLKTNYIDTGKVRFIYRNFHLDQLAFAGAMLAECAPRDQYFPIIALIFKNQDQWIRARKQSAHFLLKFQAYQTHFLLVQFLAYLNVTA